LMPYSAHRCRVNPGAWSKPNPEWSKREWSFERKKIGTPISPAKMTSELPTDVRDKREHLPQRTGTGLELHKRIRAPLHDLGRWLGLAAGLAWAAAGVAGPVSTGWLAGSPWSACFVWLAVGAAGPVSAGWLGGSAWPAGSAWPVEGVLGLCFINLPKPRNGAVRTFPGAHARSSEGGAVGFAFPCAAPMLGIKAQRAEWRKMTSFRFSFFQPNLLGIRTCQNRTIEQVCIP